MIRRDVSPHELKFFVYRVIGVSRQKHEYKDCYEINPYAALVRRHLMCLNTETSISAFCLALRVAFNIEYFGHNEAGDNFCDCKRVIN